MKKNFLFVFLALMMPVLHAQEFEGIEKGDKEISVYGFLITTVGSDYSYSSGNFFLSYGAYLTDKFLFGIAPGLSVSTSQNMAGETEVNTDFSGQVFLNYNFAVNKPSFPYVRAAFYQNSFDIPDDGEWKDYASVQVGLGYKSFLSERISWDTTLTYGFSLAENADGGLLMLMTGISVLL
jgi:hypothetical protein